MGGKDDVSQADGKVARAADVDDGVVEAQALALVDRDRPGEHERELAARELAAIVALAAEWGPRPRPVDGS